MTLPTELIRERRERTFLVLAGIFLSAMTLLNVVGITRFIQLGPLALAVGVLPYPLTFLCTDLISELYGRARANFLVSVGLGINCLILAVLTLGATAPAVPESMMPPWQVLQLAAPVTLPALRTAAARSPRLERRRLAPGEEQRAIPLAKCMSIMGAHIGIGDRVRYRAQSLLERGLLLGRIERRGR